jgi:DnaJ-class molecular chaperone
LKKNSVKKLTLKLRRIKMCKMCLGINSSKCPICGESEKKIKCADCNGKGTYVHCDVDTGDTAVLTCERCDGTGDEPERKQPHEVMIDLFNDINKIFSRKF